MVFHFHGATPWLSSQSSFRQLFSSTFLLRSGWKRRQCGGHGRRTISVSTSPSDDLWRNNHYVQHLCNGDRLIEALRVIAASEDINYSEKTYILLLKACRRAGRLIHARQVHNHLIFRAIPLTGLLGEYMVVTLAKFCAIEDALCVLLMVPSRTALSWTAIISAYVDQGYGHEALKMYKSMLEDHVDPDKYTFVTLIKACGRIPDLIQGKLLHKEARDRGLVSDIFVGNTLVSMYGKCGAISEAEAVFCDLLVRNVVSWNSLLSAYVEQDQAQKAILLYRQMLADSISPDHLTITIVLQACGHLAEKEEAISQNGTLIKGMAFELGCAFHKNALFKSSGVLNLVAANTLMSMYGKCGAITEAENVFCSQNIHDITSWNVMLSAYIEQGKYHKALLFYSWMVEENMNPDQHTFVFAVTACSKLLDEFLFMDNGFRKPLLEIAHALNEDVWRKNLSSDVYVGTALVTMYGKLGDVSKAENVFISLSKKNIVTWTAMLWMYVDYGQSERVLDLYLKMQEESFEMDDVTFISVLQASSDTGSHEICKEVHYNIICAGYDLALYTESSLIDSYFKCGYREDAQEVFDELPRPHLEAWTACVDGYAGEGNTEASLRVFETHCQTGGEPNAVTFISSLSCLSHTGLIVEGIKCFVCMLGDYGILPDVKHFAVMTDLLGRAGDFKRLENMLSNMQVEADSTVWMSVLHACHIHGNLELAQQVFHQQPKHSAAFVLMSNIYAEL